MHHPMLEQMATAIARHCPGIDHDSCIAATRAALEVLREPDTDMLEAAWPGCPDFGSLPDDWRTMVTHILRNES